MDILTDIAAIVAAVVFFVCLFSIKGIILENIYGNIKVFIRINSFSFKCFEQNGEFIFSAAVDCYIRNDTKQRALWINGVSFNARMPDILQYPVVINNNIQYILKQDETRHYKTEFKAVLSQKQYETLNNPAAEKSILVFGKKYVLNMNADYYGSAVAGKAVIPR